MNNKFKIVATITVLSMFAPVLVLAAADVAPKPVQIKAEAVNFCTNVNSYATRVTNQLANNEGNLKNRQEQNQNALKERETNRDRQLIQTRNYGDADRLEVYNRLEEKAVTEAQKQAVAQFKTAVEAAVAARRASVDAAIKTYWEGMNTAMDGRESAVSTAKENFINALNSAVGTAKEGCTAGTAPATVRQQFMASVQAAKTKFNTDRKAIDKYGPQVKALVQTRNQEVQKAMSEFKKVMEQQRLILKATLGA